MWKWRAQSLWVVSYEIVVELKDWSRGSSNRNIDLGEAFEIVDYNVEGKKIAFYWLQLD